MYRLFALEYAEKNGIIFGMRKKFDKRILLLLFFFALILGNLLIGMVSAAAAGTAGNMPWESPLKKIGDSLTGPVAQTLCLIMVVVSVGTLMFGGDLSGWAKSVAFMTLAAGIIGGASSFITLMGVTGALII